MKKLLFAILITIFAASCSVFNNNSHNSKYGTWKKVSVQRGNYVGKRNMSRGTAAFSAMHVMSSAVGDTTTADTSYINNAGQISMSVGPITYNNNYSIGVTFRDSVAQFNWQNAKAVYITDSTALTFERIHDFGVIGKNDQGEKIRFLFLNRCKGVQAKNEYLIVDVYGKDSTADHQVFKIYVNGLKKIGNDLVASCKK